MAAVATGKFGIQTAPAVQTRFCEVAAAEFVGSALPHLPGSFVAAVDAVNPKKKKDRDYNLGRELGGKEAAS